MVSTNRYSHHARRALSHATLLVRRFHHPRVDTGHLLVGVMMAHGSIGHRVLAELDLHAAQAMRELASLTLPLDEAVEDPANDAALDIALDLAADEAAWLGHHYIGTEHMLLGITRTNVGNASDLLRLLDVQPEHVRRNVRRILKEGVQEFTLQLARRNARLSELSRRVITGAEQMAVAMDHPTVGLGHLLLTIARERRSTISALLIESGLDADRLRADLDAAADPALISVEMVLTDAANHAQALSNHYTGTEHLLLALVGDESGTRLLAEYGVDPDLLRARVEQQLRNQR
jgi:ATP-dependent Clp protease ATP-binding subunit ClpA